MSNAKHVTDNLSAYLDNQLSAAERARVAAHLRTCSQCQADLESLRYTQRVLNAMPALRAPRSFTLSSEQAARARPAWQAGWLYRALQGATAVAAILFLVVVGFDALSPAGPHGAVSAPAPSALRLTTPLAPQSQADSAANESKAATSAPAGAVPPAAATRQPTITTPVAVATVAPFSAAATHTPTTSATHQPVIASGGSSETPAPAPTATPAPTNTVRPTATPPPNATHTATPPPAPTSTVGPPARTPTLPEAATADRFGLRLVELSLFALVLLGTSALVIVRFGSR